MLRDLETGQDRTGQKQQLASRHAMASNLALSPAITKYATAVFEQSTLGSDVTLESFLQRLDSPESSEPLPVQADTSHPLPHYFISSSHNTCKSCLKIWLRSNL